MSHTQDTVWRREWARGSPPHSTIVSVAKEKAKRHMTAGSCVPFRGAVRAAGRPAGAPAEAGRQDGAQVPEQEHHRRAGGQADAQPHHQARLGFPARGGHRLVSHTLTQTDKAEGEESMGKRFQKFGGGKKKNNFFFFKEKN